MTTNDTNTSDTEQIDKGLWPSETPILAHLLRRLGTAWPHFRVTEHIDEHDRHFTLIEWGDSATEFDPTAPNDFVDFVKNRPEPDGIKITDSDTK